MFDKANLGQVIWPVEVPDLDQPPDEKGNPKVQRVLVRFRVYTRAELRARDRGVADKLTTSVQQILEPRPNESAQDRATRIEHDVAAMYAEVDRRDDEATHELLERTLGFYPAPGEPLQAFGDGQLAELLGWNHYFKPFRDALNAASREAVAKN